MFVQSPPPDDRLSHNPAVVAFQEAVGMCQWEKCSMGCL